MFKVAWLLRRKPGITFEQFRDHYETSHAVLGQTYFGHLIQSYTRNYNLRPDPRAEAAGPIDRFVAARQWDYDCITEWELRDEQALVEIFELLFDPKIGKIFHDDEEHFLDRDAVRLVRCDVHMSEPGPASR
jgi:hypothetical protein